MATDAPKDKPAEAPRGLTDDDIYSFLTANARPECPSCGHTDWSIVSPTNVGELEITTNTEKAPQAVLPLIVLVCSTCAFVRMHSFKHVKAWPGRAV